MNIYRIGIVVGLAIALVAYPGQNLQAAKKKAPAPQAQGNPKANPKDPGGHSAKGVEFAKKKEYDQAIAEFTEAIKAEPNDGKNYFNRGTAYRGAGKMEEARADFAKAIEMMPDNAAAYVGRGEVLVQQKQWDAAEADFDKALQIAPEDVSARRFPRVCLFVERRLREGSRSLRKSIGESAR
jgi:Cytochrome c biogenesis factor